MQGSSFIASLTSTLDGGEWLVPRPGHFTSSEITPCYPFSVRLGGPQSRSGRFGEEKCLGPVGNRAQYIVAHRLVTILITLYRLLDIG
jgi:hypothetical protein